MNPEMEKSLIEKVDRIYVALVGLEGQEDEGLLARVRGHERRLNTLENWRWYLTGGGAVALALLKLFKVL